MKIVAHSSQILFLEQQFRGDKLPHSFLFTGPEGIGKKQVALHLIQLLFCSVFDSRPCGTCRDCQLVEHFSHPDFLFLFPEKETLRIDQIRQLKQFLSFQPLEKEWKVVLIEGAEKLNGAASNALLKTLEEPPPHSLIILNSSLPSRLLKTIVSRCQKIHFSPLTEKETCEVLRMKGIQIEKIENHPFLHLGSPGKILSSPEEVLNVFSKEFVDFLNVKKGILDRLTHAERFSKEGSFQKTVLELFLNYLHLKIIENPQPLLIKQFDLVQEGLNDLSLHVNSQLVFETVFLNLDK